MKTTIASIFLALSFSTIASDSKDCTGKQVIGYGLSSMVTEFSATERIIVIESGSAKDLYEKLGSEAVVSQFNSPDSYTTKTSKTVTCFKQEISGKDCAMYSCNIFVRN